jgi:hypothetical protein
MSKMTLENAREATRLGETRDTLLADMVAMTRDAAGVFYVPKRKATSFHHDRPETFTFVHLVDELRTLIDREGKAQLAAIDAELAKLGVEAPTALNLVKDPKAVQRHVRHADLATTMIYDDNPEEDLQGRVPRN